VRARAAGAVYEAGVQTFATRLAARLDGLMLFRSGLGLWLLLSPWLIGTHLDPSGTSDTLAGLAVIAIASGAEKHTWLRFVQAAVALWVIFSAVLLEPAELQRYNEILVGKLLLLTAPVSRKLLS
jgi:hypothetical protein